MGRALVAAIAILVLPSTAARAQVPPRSLAVQSSAFRAGGVIPPEFTCNGAGRSPPISWSVPPAATQSVVVIVDDLDAPGVFTNWAVFDLSSTVRSLDAGASGGLMPAGAQEGVSSAGGVGYAPVCPAGGRHRIRIRVFALDETIDTLVQPTSWQLEQAMRGHVLAAGFLVGVAAR